MKKPALPSSEIPPTPSIGVAGLVFNSSGHILLIRRKLPPQAGLWHIPGGKLESGESLAECCRREVFEETGMIVTPSSILAVADRNIEGFHYIIIDFLAHLNLESPVQPIPSSDAIEARWVHPDALIDYPLVTGLDAIIRSGQSFDHLNSGLGLAPIDQHPWLFACPWIRP